MLHLHDLDHVEIDRFLILILRIYMGIVGYTETVKKNPGHTFWWGWRANCQYGINNICSKLLRENTVDFSSKRGICDVNQSSTIQFDRLLESVKELYHDPGQLSSKE